MASSNLKTILEAGHFAVTAELGPPKGAGADVVREKARLLKGAADAVNITDCQTAIVRMSSIAAGAIAMGEGIEPVVQMTCRDRNRIGIQSDLLGAWALGARNLLCLTGDHQKFGNHPQSKNVFDLDSMQLLDLARNLADKKFQCGDEVEGEAPAFFIGAAENPFADPFDFRALRLAKKAAAGAQFIQTQIIYDVDKFTRWMEAVRELGTDKQVYILGGVTPLKSVGMARYMQKNVPGLDVPEELIDRLKAAPDAKEEGINICVETIEKIRAIEGVSGVHIMAIEWEAAVPTIVERAGLLPRPVV